MKSSLPILVTVTVAFALPATAVLLRAQTTGTAQQPDADLPVAIPTPVTLPEPDQLQPVPQPTPDQLLAEAVDLLGRHRSITAKLRYHAAMYGRDVIGSGEYVQGPASSRLVRYALRMQAGARNIDFLEINDGIYLWRRVQYETEPEVERIDVDRILAADQKAQRAMNPASLLTLGGLGRLLSTLRRDYEFTQSLPPGRLGNAPVYGIVGHWRPAVLEPRGFKSVDELRPHVPHEVVLYLGCDDLFPYSVEFRRTEKGAGEGGTSKMLLKLDLFELRFDVPLDASQFQFAAEHRAWVDITDRTLTER
jgi:hypothetical protein